MNVPVIISTTVSLDTSNFRIRVFTPSRNDLIRFVATCNICGEDLLFHEDEKMVVSNTGIVIGRQVELEAVLETVAKHQQDKHGELF